MCVCGIAAEMPVWQAVNCICTNCKASSCQSSSSSSSSLLLVLLYGRWRGELPIWQRKLTHAYLQIQFFIEHLFIAVCQALANFFFFSSFQCRVAVHMLTHTYTHTRVHTFWLLMSRQRRKWHACNSHHHRRHRHYQCMFCAISGMATITTTTT